MTTWFVEVGSIGKLNLIGLSMTQAVGNVQLIFQGQMSN